MVANEADYTSVIVQTVGLEERQRRCKVGIYKQGDSLCLPPAAPDSDTFHHIATYLHHIHMHAIKCCKQSSEWADLASRGTHPPAASDLDTFNHITTYLHTYTRML